MLSHDGRFYRLGDDGKPFRDRDRTIASLLASLHILVAEDNFNRFFSYTDEIRPGSDTDDEHYGIEWIYEDLTTQQARKLTAQKIGDA